MAGARHHPSTALGPRSPWRAPPNLGALPNSAAVPNLAGVHHRPVGDAREGAAAHHAGHLGCVPLHSDAHDQLGALAFS